MPIMRRALLLAPLLLSWIPGCGGDDQAPGATQPADSGANVDTSAAPADSAEVDSSTGSDSSIGDSTSGDSSDGAVDSTVVDSGTPDVPAGSDALFIADTYVDALKPEGGIPDGSVFTDATFDGGPDASPALVPVGAACSSSSTCDPTGAGAGVCSNQEFPPDSIDPSPACVAKSCDSTVGNPCGVGGAGLCVLGGVSGICRPGCSFGSTGAATGCLGKTSCVPSVFRRESSTVRGLGFCTGGCTADVDCPSGQQCQTEDGTCVATKTVYSKSFGDACTSASDCKCERMPGKTGYCTRFCVTGRTSGACPSGYSCDARVPATDSSGTLFTGVATGLAGACRKVCSSDADCTSYGGHCESNVAGGVKVCRVP